MKVTLRQVAEGIVATVDERPIKGDWSYDAFFDVYSEVKHSWAHDDEECHKIIASTIPKVGKELVVDLKKYNAEMLNNGTSITDCEYTETENQIIINL